jgi:hypothetical protein
LSHTVLIMFSLLMSSGMFEPGVFACILPEITHSIHDMCIYVRYIYTTGNIYIRIYIYIYMLCLLILCYINHSCHVDVYIIIYIYTNPMMDGKRNPNVSLPRLPRAAKELEILQIPWTAVGHSDLSKLICGDGTCLRRV